MNRINNFDLIRLIAALEVLLNHSLYWLNIPRGYLNNLSFAFPGVSIFFVISGILIAKSFEYRTNDVNSYIKSRLLRIYPALYACFFVTLIVLGAFGYLEQNFVTSKQFLFWIVTQLTFYQNYTPHNLHSFGIGGPNGSLWTIPIEISFYIILPFISLFYDRLSKSKGNIFLVGLFLASFLLNCQLETIQAKGLFLRHFAISIFPYLHMFILGIIICKNFVFFHNIAHNKFHIWSLIYLIAAGIFIKINNISDSVIMSYFDPKTFLFLICLKILLAICVFSAAFSFQELSSRILKGQDISYGIYIYHGLIINIFIELGLVGKAAYIFPVLLISLSMGLISWKLIESKAINLKQSKVV